MGFNILLFGTETSISENSPFCFKILSISFANFPSCSLSSVFNPNPEITKSAVSFVIEFSKTFSLKISIVDFFNFTFFSLHVLSFLLRSQFQLVLNCYQNFLKYVSNILPYLSLNQQLFFHSLF